VVKKLAKDGVLCVVSCESVETAHHYDSYAALSNSFAQACECGAMVVYTSCLHLCVALIVGHDVPMLKAVVGAAFDLRLEFVYLAQRLELGGPGIERCSF
jgi:hypothetical protein